MAKRLTQGPVTLRTSMTQGATDAFVQGTFNTGLSSIASSTGFILKSITFEFGNSSFTAGGLVVREVALTRASKSGTVPTIADDDVLYKFKQSFYYATAVGLQTYEDQVVHQEISNTDEILVIEDILYLQYDTNGFANATTAYVNLVLEPATITTDERIAILQSRLN